MLRRTCLKLLSSIPILGVISNNKNDSKYSITHKYADKLYTASYKNSSNITEKGKVFVIYTSKGCFIVPAFDINNKSIDDINDEALNIIKYDIDKINNVYVFYHKQYYGVLSGDFEVYST